MFKSEAGTLFTGLIRMESRVSFGAKEVCTNYQVLAEMRIWGPLGRKAEILLIGFISSSRRLDGFDSRVTESFESIIRLNNGTSSRWPISSLWFL